MINLKTEEFVLDGPPLQSLQQLIQWVGDFVLYLMANLPNQVGLQCTTICVWIYSYISINSSYRCRPFHNVLKNCATLQKPMLTTFDINDMMLH